jgi:hypothetical protein
MTRPLKAAVAAALLAFAVCLLAPTVAAAADAAPWVGTYKGVAVGKDAKGTKGSTGVTIWVEDLGDSTKFTFRFDKFPVIISQTAPNDGGQKGSMLMGISVEERGVSGAGLVVVYPKKGNYMMAGKGAGKAIGKQGTGRMGAVRTSTGVELPSVKQQFSDLMSALLSRKVKTTTGKPAGSSDATPVVSPVDLVSDDTGTVYAAAQVTSEPAVTQEEADAAVKQSPTVVFVTATTVEPASVIDLAAAKPPATTQTVFTVMVLLLVLTVVAAVVSVGPKMRQPAAAPVSAGEPSSDGEGS